MNVQTVKIKDFKILKDLEAEVAGNHILLIGDNGVGKSSFIQFIEIALGKQTNVPLNAKGHGEVVFQKDGQPITFKVDFRDGKPYIKVSGKGISIDNKKGAIAELVGALDFNIDEFVELSKTTAGRREQVKQFKSFLPADIVEGIAKFEADVNNDMEERKQLNVEIKKLKGSLALSTLYSLPDSELLKFQPVDTVEVMAELKAANEKNDKRAKVENGIEQRKALMKSKLDEITQLQEKIDKLNAEIGAADKEVKDGLAWLKANPLITTTALENTISEAGQVNQKAEQAKTHLAERKKLATLEEEAGELTAKIESSKEAIAIAIRDMEGPIEGLSFDDETLIYKGVPVSPDTLSTSEVMELGIRLKMAENPELGILFIQRGESLGAERLQLIRELADAEGWQIIMEQVERGKKELQIEIIAAND